MVHGNLYCILPDSPADWGEPNLPARGRHLHWIAADLGFALHHPGIVGILLGIPTFSVLYALLRETVRRRLYKKGLTKEKFQRKIFPEAQTKGKAAAENMVETSSIDSERK